MQVTVLLVFGNMKPNFFVDEIWTFNLANSYFFPCFDNVDGYFYTWLSGDFWHSIITVKPGTEFAWDSVWYNQSQDVHPPFYYAVIHLVCSFFPDQFSKWFGIGPNIFFFVLTQVVLFLLSQKIFRKTWHAFLPCLIYGFTLGAINTVNYIRMYMMLTFFCVLALYIHFLFLERVAAAENEKKLLRYLPIIELVNILGFLTHYYYIIFIFFVTVAALFVLQLYQYKKMVYKYIGAGIAGLAVCFAIYPFYPKQILGLGKKEIAYRGAESMGNAFNSRFLANLAEFCRQLLVDIGGDIVLLLLLFVALLVLREIAKQIMNWQVSKEGHNFKLALSFHKPSSTYSWCLNAEDIRIMLIGLIVSAYFAVICKIAVMNDDRYIFNILPLIVLCGYYILNKLITRFTGKEYLALLLVVFCVWVSVFTSGRVSNIKFVDVEIAIANEEVKEKYTHTPMIVINSGRHWHPVIEKAPMLETMDKSYLLTENELEKIPAALQEISHQGDFMVFVTWECKQPRKDIMENVLKETGYKRYTKFYESSKFNRGAMYILSR